MRVVDDEDPVGRYVRAAPRDASAAFLSLRLSNHVTHGY